MNRKDNEKKSEELNKILQASCKNYVFVRSHDEITSIGMQGTIPELCYMAHELCNSIREKAAEFIGEEGANYMIKKITLTEEEMDEEIERNANRIPKWLKDLMDLNDDKHQEAKNDTADEAERNEENDAEEIVNRLEDILKRYHLRGDLDLHLSDDDSE